MTEPYKIGNRIRKFRTEHGLKQKEMAEKIGVDRTSLSSYENNKTCSGYFYAVPHC